GLGADLVADGGVALQAAVAEQRAGDLDPALRGHADGAGGGQHGGGLPAGLAAGGADPHVDGHRRGLDRLDERLEAVVGHHGAAAVELQHQRDGPSGGGLVDLGLHEVDEDPVEEAADLDDRDVPGAGPGVAVLGGGGRGGGGEQHRERGQKCEDGGEPL